MSAFIPSDKHFQYIANYLVKRGTYKPQDVEPVIQILIKACYKSVNTRYGTSEKYYQFRFKENNRNAYNAAQFINLCLCVMYQASEIKNHQNKKHYKILQNLVFDACSDLDAVKESKWTI